MARSLLRQLEQIRRAATYDDAVASVNTSAVAEPTVSGSLEQDTNIFRTLLKQLKGTTNWYDDPGKYFDPTNTDGSNTANKQLSLANISGNTLDSKTIILAVSNDNSGSGFTVTTGASGVLMTTTTRYATTADRTGLPIFASTAGAYFDEGGADNVARVDIINMATNSEIVDGSGNVIYGKFHDGIDFGATGSGTDVYVRFYANGSVATMSSGVSSIELVYPYRKRLTDVQEYEWLRTDFVSSWEGDIELIEDVSNLWAFTGATNNDADAGPWTNTGAGYLLQTDPNDLKTATDLLNTGVGSRQDGNYITATDTIAESLVDLDTALDVVAGQISAGIGEKYIESVTTLIAKNTAHDISAIITSYTPFSDGGREGKNMDVYVDGQLLAADTGAAGANADRDYGETSTTAVTFRFDVQVGRNITYVVRQ
jgi:hypothetical protein